MYKYIIMFFLIVGAVFGQQKIVEKNNKLYFADKLVVKFKNSNDKALFKNSAVPKAATKTLQNVGVVEIKQLTRLSNQKSKYFDDVNNTRVVTFAKPYDAEQLARKISASPGIEWAEPYYIYRTTLTPNDPKFQDETQWYLNKISASEAWDISQGSDEIVIAINDTGVDWDHPDLADRIWNNEDEVPGNGIDDDNNGYIDDIRGWDFGGLDGTPDNDPMEDSPTHGTYIAGFASAVTNNGQGIAAIGYNCKLMPVKTSQDDLERGTIAYGLEGIIYAAENGADVINLSWGGSPYSLALQEAINYATSLGALVVSSSDNDDTIEPTYPSSYDNVLSVGGTDPNDQRYVGGKYGSNYGSTVDVTAPATGSTPDSAYGMYSTWQNDSYLQNSNGTSLASPIVAGLAGLVIDRFPDYSPQQVAEQIRVNTDDISGENPGFEYYLGTGRVNAFKTLNNTNSISVRASDFVFTDLSNGNGITEPGESFTLGMKFTNYLNLASNISVTIESRSEFVTITQGSYLISSMNSLSETDNYSAPFVFTIAENIPVNESVELLITFNADGSYDDFQLIRPKFNTTYLTQRGNNVALTITSIGSLGFDDYDETPNEGEGLIFSSGFNVLFEAGFLYGNSPSGLMDAVHTEYLAERSTDFENVIPFSIDTPGSVSDHQGVTVFNDNGADQSLGIETHLNSYSFAAEQNENFIILEYDLFNRTERVIDNLFAGVFFDLDMNDFDDDKVDYHDSGRFAYALDNDINDATRIEDQIAVALISDTSYGYRALSNDGTFEGISTTHDFDDGEKWLSISSGVSNTEYEGDIAFTVSGGPYSIQPDSLIKVAFAVAGGYTTDQLNTAIQNSRNAYSQFILNESPNIPAGIADFTSGAKKGNLILSWTTQNEENTRSFKLFQNDSLIATVSSKAGGSGSATYEYSYPLPGSGVYEFKINQVFLDFSEITIATENFDLTEFIPDEFTLYQNYPNPFNDATKMKFDIPEDFEHNVKLKIFDVLGREAAVLLDKNLLPGEYNIEFNADKYGLSSGIYFYRLSAGNKILTKKMLLLK